MTQSKVVVVEDEPEMLEIVKIGRQVRVLDILEPQVHGPSRTAPSYLNRAAELVIGDVRNRDQLRAALEGVQVVFHLAAAVGVGQSMYEIERYVSVNTLGTSILLDILANENPGVRKLVVASSMSLYGEGSYSCPNCGPMEAAQRTEEQMAQARWEPLSTL